MRTNEIIDGIRQGQKQGKSFIKWWRIENDFIDYETFDSFIEHAGSKHEIAGYELLDIDEMWAELKRWKPTGLNRRATTRGEEIEWQHLGADGTLKVETCPLTARSIMHIFNAETGGDVVGS